MSIQEFAQALEQGEVATEIAKLRDLPETAVLRNEDDDGTIAALWPKWTSYKKEI